MAAGTPRFCNPRSRTRPPLAFIEALDEVTAALSTSLPLHAEPFSEEGRSFYLCQVERSSRHNAAFAKQTGNPEAWFKWHAVIPATTSQGIVVELKATSGRLAADLEALGRSGHPLIAWVGHFDDDARLTFETSLAGKVRLLGIEPTESRRHSIERTLEAAATAKARVVVMPECTIDLAGRRVAWRESIS